MNNFDCVITGARCAGASLAIYLARAGYRVLLVDKAFFPSDTLSTNTFFNNTTSLLRELGVMDSLLQTNVTPVRHIKFHFEDTVIEGQLPVVDGEDTAYSIRRTHLDHILLQKAASYKNVTVIEGFRVMELIYEGENVIGVRGEERTGLKREFRGRLIVGADGRNSTMRRLVKSKQKLSIPSNLVYYFSYFKGAPHEGPPKFEVYKRMDKMAVLFPTNDQLYAVTVNFSVGDKRMLSRFKKEPEKSLRLLLQEHFPNTSLGARIKNARLIEPFRGFLNYNNYWYEGMGKGWALVGDALCFKDPAVAQGIHDAIFGAKILAQAIHKLFQGEKHWEAVAEEYQKTLETRFLARFYMGCELSQNASISEEQDVVNRVISVHPVVIEKFLGVYNYANEPEEFEKELHAVLTTVDNNPSRS